MQHESTAAGLRRRIESRQAVVGVIGMGYVGLPLTLAFARAGFRGLGFDVDPDKIEALEAGRSYIRHLDGGEVAAAFRPGSFQASADFARLAECDAVLICVPTPLTPQREPDMRYVTATAAEIRDRLRPGQLVVLESTTYPGTTDELVRPELERTGLRCGVDFFLAFSPEREDPNNSRYTTTTIPKVVGGVDPVSGELACLLYGTAIRQIVPVVDARTAEAVKLTENIFRAVNIALVNELKIVYERMGIDIWEVLDAAATKPFGFMRFDPGPGWGGHCIPLDPFYLTWKAREYGLATRFIELAGEVNVRMPDYVVERLVLALNQERKPIRGSRILLLGLAYKRNVDDPRESPAFEILELLLKLGAEVDYHDPHIPAAPPMRRHPELPELHSLPLTEANLAACDAVVIVTDHDQVDYELVARTAPLIVDSRGVMRRFPGRARVVPA